MLSLDVSRTQLAELWECHPRSVDNVVRDRGTPAAPDGRFDLAVPCDGTRAGPGASARRMRRRLFMPRRNGPHNLDVRLGELRRARRSKRLDRQCRSCRTVLEGFRPGETETPAFDGVGHFDSTIIREISRRARGRARSEEEATDHAAIPVDRQRVPSRSSGEPPRPSTRRSRLLRAVESVGTGTEAFAQRSRQSTAGPTRRDGPSRHLGA